MPSASIPGRSSISNRRGRHSKEIVQDNKTANSLSGHFSGHRQNGSVDRRRRIAGHHRSGAGHRTFAIARNDLGILRRRAAIGQTPRGATLSVDPGPELATSRAFPGDEFGSLRAAGVEACARLPQIGSNKAEKGSLVISFPKLSSIKIEQHERRDSESSAPRRQAILEYRNSPGKMIAKRNRLSRPQKTLLPSKNRSLGRRAQSQTARCNSSGSNAFAGIEHFSSNIPGGKPVYWSLRQEKIWSKNRDIQESEERLRQFTSVVFSLHA